MAAPGTIVVIGASAGGVDALRTIVAALPANIDAAICVTLHIGAHRSELPWLLARAGAPSAAHAVDGEALRAGHIHVAPPDQHLTIEGDTIRLTRGPRENMARPAIDPLFRSAARQYGAAVIGVILTGGLNDGTAGLIAVADHGGITIVQEPTDAFSPSMPQSAIDNLHVDHVCLLDAIGPLVAQLVAERHDITPALHDSRGGKTAEDRAMTAQFTLHAPVAVTCPDCGGALRRSEVGSLTQFSCHIGHIYTAEVMLAAQFLTMERFVEQAIRSLSERAELCRVMMAKAGNADPVATRDWEAAMTEALDQTAPLRVLLDRAWVHPHAAGLIELPRA